MICTLTIKQLAANKIRLLATSFAIILGVAFLAGTLILTDTIKGTLNGVLAEADAGTDAYVRSSSALELGYGQTARTIDAPLTEAIGNVDGVDQVSIAVSGYAQILDKKGKAVGAASTGVLGMNSPSSEHFLRSLRSSHCSLERSSSTTRSRSSFLNERKRWRCSGPLVRPDGRCDLPYLPKLR
jgi:hypothetical protein